MTHLRWIITIRIFWHNVIHKRTGRSGKTCGKESYAGICDEVRIGVTLIFYLQNVVDFLAVKGSKKYMNLEEGVILGALSTEGKILLPINKTEKKISRTSRIQRTAIIWLQPQEMGMKMRSRI